MPLQSHSGRGICPWHRCDRCGWDFPVSMLRRQLGLILCDQCFDNPIAWQRPLMIQDLLGSMSNQELRPADILQSNQSDDMNALSD
jgi:recombinational DNA repair protein (RecF pathway)